MVDIKVYCMFNWVRWEKYQSEEEAALGRGKRQRKAVSYREAYAPHPSETLSEVILFAFFMQADYFSKDIVFYDFFFFFPNQHMMHHYSKLLTDAKLPYVGVLFVFGN